MRRSLTAAGPLSPTPATLSDFYREEFIKHHRCLQRQREYFSASAVERVECALLRIIAEMDRLSASEDADRVVERLLREFDVVTGLSAWSDPHQVH